MKLVQKFIQRRVWLLNVLKLTIFTVLINLKINYLNIFQRQASYQHR